MGARGRQLERLFATGGGTKGTGAMGAGETAGEKFEWRQQRKDEKKHGDL